MKRRFVIPLAVAMALHAILLFGFRTPGIPPASGVVRPPVNPTPRDPAIEVIMASDTNDPDSTPAPGNPARTRPDVPAPPVRDPITQIAITSTIPDPNPVNPATNMTPGPVGVPDGGHFGPHGPGFVSATVLDNPPRTRSQLAPVYPYEARVNARNGEVTVEFVVDEAGRVLDPHVLRSSNPLFEAPTLRAVAKWRFEPGRKGGRVVRFRMAVPVEFAVNP